MTRFKVTKQSGAEEFNNLYFGVGPAGQLEITDHNGWLVVIFAPGVWRSVRVLTERSTDER